MYYANSMAKAEIVWVYGASAAGKETFIRAVLAGQQPRIVKALGWQGKRLGACQESLEWVMQHPHDTAVEQKRHQLSGVIPRIAKRYEVVLVKGQDIDLSLGTPLLVKQKLPAARHRIIFIDVGLDELFQRVTHKPWWDGTIRRAEEEGWLEEQIDRLMEIRNQFDFITIDGGAMGHYERHDSKGNFI